MQVAITLGQLKYNILIVSCLRKRMIFFNPFLLQNRGEVRTLHHLKERLSFYYAV